MSLQSTIGEAPVRFLRMQFADLCRLLLNRTALFKVALATAASSMLLLSTVLPWWSISTDIGAASAPLWASQPLQGWATLGNTLRPDWYLLLPILMAVLVSLLLVDSSWKEGVALFSLVSFIVPWEMASAQSVLSGYFLTYLDAASSSTSLTSGVIGHFDAVPAAGFVLYLVGYSVMTILLAYKLILRDKVPFGRMNLVSILVVFSSLCWYLIGSLAYPDNPSWSWVMALDAAFIATTGVLLWSSLRNGWLSSLRGWRERAQITLLPALVVLDALTTNYALPVVGSGGPLSASNAQVHDASLLVNTVQNSGLPQVAYLFWSLLILQVVALSCLTLGLASNEKLRSFPRFLASYTLYMMIAAYSFTVSNNILLIFTGRTWFQNSYALVLVVALAVTLAFILSVSSVWGLTRLSDLKRDWRVHF